MTVFLRVCPSGLEKSLGTAYRAVSDDSLLIRGFNWLVWALWSSSVFSFWLIEGFFSLGVAVFFAFYYFGLFNELSELGLRLIFIPETLLFFRLWFKLRLTVALFYLLLNLGVLIKGGWIERNLCVLRICDFLSELTGVLNKSLILRISCRRTELSD